MFRERKVSGEVAVTVAPPLLGTSPELPRLAIATLGSPPCQDNSYLPGLAYLLSRQGRSPAAKPVSNCKRQSSRVRPFRVQ